MAGMVDKLYRNGIVLPALPIIYAGNVYLLWCGGFEKETNRE